MPEIYNGRQARIKAGNSLAMYVPCATHSLNFIGECVAESCSDVTKLFYFVLKCYLPVNSKLPKTLSNTRWSARIDTVNALVAGYHYFKKELNDTDNTVAHNNYAHYVDN